MSAQVKTYVEVEPYDGITQFKDAAAERIIKSFCITDDLAALIVRLVEYLIEKEADGKARIISGGRGVGKSHLLWTMYHLMSSHRARELISLPQVRSAIQPLSKTPSLPLAINLSANDETPFADLLVAALRPTVPALSAPSRQQSDAADRLLFLEQLSRSIPERVKPVFFIDGVSARLREGSREKIQEIVAWLESICEATGSSLIKAVIAVDENHLGPGDELAVKLGANSYTVEYLPPDNLKRITDFFIFKKSAKQRIELRNVYNSLKQMLPDFRWGEEDFAALYPVHPIVYETALGMRAFSHSYSFLSFVASSALRALNRRAFRLIALDEVFDRFEYDLRKNEKLSEGFKAYDKLVNKTVPRLPSSQRLLGRLLLKSLFILSLSQRAVTARELANSLLLFDEKNPQASYQMTQDILAQFEQGCQQLLVSGDVEEKTYLLVIEDEGMLDRSIAAEAEQIADNDKRLFELLVGIGGRRFSDWPLTINEAADSFIDSANIGVEWRGTIRQGQLCFNSTAETTNGDDERSELDWQLIIWPPSIEQLNPPSNPKFIYWQPAVIEPPELDLLKQLLVIKTVINLSSEKFSRFSARLQALTTQLETQAESLFSKIYLDGGCLKGKDLEIPSLESWRSCDSLIAALSGVVREQLDKLYRQHPNLSGLLTTNEVEILSVKLFGGVAPSDSEVQLLAEKFAAPLHLVSNRSGEYRLDIGDEEDLLHDYVREAIRIIKSVKDDIIPLSEIYWELRRAPYGLQKEAQQLLFVALVAAWRIELTNEVGTETIGAYDLSRPIDFSRYMAIRRVSAIAYSTEVLTQWCRRLSGIENLPYITTIEGRTQMLSALRRWQQSWIRLNLDQRFTNLPPEAHTTRIWQMFTSSKRYFDQMAAAIEAIVQERVSPERGLARIIDTFGANEEVYEKAAGDLQMLSDFVSWMPNYSKARDYALASDRTHDSKIEADRQELIGFFNSPYQLFDQEKRRRFETTYSQFRSAYIEAYTAAHEAVATSTDDFEAFEEYTRSELFQRFSLLNQLKIGDHRFQQQSSAIIRIVRRLRCGFQPHEFLMSKPHCGCAFRIGRSARVLTLLAGLQSLVDQAIRDHHRLLVENNRRILSAIDRLKSELHRQLLREFMASLPDNERLNGLTALIVDLINQCLEQET